MSDYISREAALSQNLAIPYIYNVEEGDAFFKAYYQYWNILANLPAADVVEQKHGEWEETKIYDGFSCFTIYKDTECGYEVARKSNYCPWSGAKMKMEEDDE